MVECSTSWNCSCFFSVKLLPFNNHIMSKNMFFLLAVGKSFQTCKVSDAKAFGSILGVGSPIEPGKSDKFITAIYVGKEDTEGRSRA